MKNIFGRTSTRGLEKHASESFKNAGGDKQVTWMQRGAGSYTFIIALIDSTTTGTATLFGYTKDATEATNTSGNVTVTPVGGTTHIAIKANTLSKPIRFKGISIATSTSALQMSNPLYFKQATPQGSESSDYWLPAAYSEPASQNQLLIKTEVFSFLIDLNKWVELAVNAGETITLTFWIFDEVNPENVLKNTPVFEANPNGVANGNAPLVIQSENMNGYAGGRRQRRY